MIGYMKVSSQVTKFFELSSTSWKVRGHGHIQLHSSPHCRKPSVHQLIGISSFWPHQNTIYCSHLYQHCIRNLHLTDTWVSSVFSFELPEEPSLPCILSKTGFLLFTFLVIWPLCVTSSKAAPVKGSISKLWLLEWEMSGTISHVSTLRPIPGALGGSITCRRWSLTDWTTDQEVDFSESITLF